MKTLVSMVKDTWATDCLDEELDAALAGIRDGRWKTKVEKVRAAYRIYGSDVSGPLKKRLPGFLFSGTFTRRNNASLVTHSGFVVADIDKLDGGDHTKSAEDRINEVWTKLLTSPYLIALFVSPTLSGLKALFRVPADPALHTASFKAVAHHVRELTGVEIDMSGSDVSRNCFVSYDPHLYSNPNAVVMPVEWRVEAPLAGLLTASQHSSIPCCSSPLLSSLKLEKHLLSFDWLADGFISKGPKQNNRMMMKIARRLLDMARELGRDLTAPEVRRLIERWFALTPPQFLTHTVNDYHEELLIAIGNAKVPLSLTPVQAAFEKAKSNPWPPWVQELPSEELRLVAAICVELQNFAGEKPFFLSSYDPDLSRAIGRTQRTAYAKLAALMGTQRLRLVRRGNQDLANEYRLTID